MLEAFFKYRGVLKRMRCGPLKDEIDCIADDLQRTGYTRKTTVRYLSLVGSFSRFAADAGCTESRGIDGSLVERFLREFPRSASTRTIAQTATGHVLRRLARVNPQAGEAGIPREPHAPLLASFDVYMRDVRGLARRSREGVLLIVRRMLAWYRGARPGRSLSRLSRADVLAYVGHVTAGGGASSSRSAALSHVRAFLRHLRWVGVIEDDLARFVPRTPCWRLATVPKYLGWSDVRRAIDAIDASDPVGMRDRAIILLLATTGLRSQELRQLELRDVRWRSSELHLRQTKGRRARVVPILGEAGRALADYVLRGRPRVPDRTLFLCHRPPVRPLRHSGALAAIVRRRLEGCGVRADRMGAHLLRHSLATRMVELERPVKEVADLLGHQSIDTTAIYVKVALSQLSDVALPFPDGGV